MMRTIGGCAPPPRVLAARDDEVHTFEAPDSGGRDSDSSTPGEGNRQRGGLMKASPARRLGSVGEDEDD